MRPGRGDQHGARDAIAEDCLRSGQHRYGRLAYREDDSSAVRGKRQRPALDKNTRTIAIQAAPHRRASISATQGSCGDLA
jgi:hypothetical protein